MTESTSKAVIKSLRQKERELTKALVSQAIQAGWPRNLASALRVRVASDDIMVTYPPLLAKDIEDLEYGTLDEGPRPVFRRFVEKQYATLNKALEDALSEILSTRGGLA